MALPFLLLMGAQTALTIAQNRKATKEQNAFYEQNAENAIEGQTYENRGINERVRQEQDVAGQQKRKKLVEALSAQSTAKARGKTTAGISIERLEQSVNNQLGEFIADINYNLEGALRNAEMQKEGVTAQTESRINSVPKADYDADADLIRGGLQIASGYQSDQRALKAASPSPSTYQKQGFFDWAFS